MFERLAAWDTIVVTGPQRSGTHIAAKMIAADTGHDYVDDSEFGTFNKARFFWKCREKKKVIHCPGMARWIHEAPGVFVVFMIRSVADIHASEKRVKWNDYGREQDNYGIVTENIAEEKYRFWKAVQKPIVQHRMAEVRYEDLAEHPLWVPKDKRSDFKWDQTAIDGESNTIPLAASMASPKYIDPYVETESWMDSVGAPFFFGFVEELKCVLEHMPYEPATVLDIGYGWGISSALWLTMFKNCRVTSIDPYPAGHYAPEHVVDNLNQQCFDRWKFIKATAEEALPAMEEQYDMVFLDSNHSKDSSLVQIELSWERVKPGGILAGHDFWSCFEAVGKAVTEWQYNTGVIVHMARPHSREGVWWTEAKV